VFIGLNVIRALSIISLILVFSSSVLTLIDDIEAFNAYQNNPGRSSHNSTTPSHDYVPNSTVPNQPAGVFWATLNRLLIIGQVIILFLSEIGWPSSFFQKFFPVLGHDFGLGPLGVIQCLIGAAILSHHVNTFTLVSAFFLFSIGCLHMLVGLIFREKVKPRRSLTAWKERAKDVLPAPVLATTEKVVKFGQDHGVDPVRFVPDFLVRDGTGDTRTTVPTHSRPGLGFGRQKTTPFLERSVDRSHHLPQYASGNGVESEL